MSPRRRTRDLDLPACMYRKHGAYWLVKRGRWTRLGKDLRAALIAYARLTAPASTAMAALIDEALPHITARVMPSTARQYRKASERLKGMLAEFEPDQIQHSDVAAIKRGLRGTPNMANRIVSVLRLILAYAAECGYIPTNPAIGITPHAEAKRTRLATWAEFRAVHAKATPRLRCFMELLAQTGQRPMDVATLERTDLTDDGIAFVQSKTGSKETVRWTPDLRDTVRRTLALHGRVARLTLFKTRHGTAPAYRTLYDEWRRACKAAGVADLDLRDLRALAGTEAKRQGKNPTALLGHTSEQMTRRYLRDKESPPVEPIRIRHLIDRRAK